MRLCDNSGKFMPNVCLQYFSSIKFLISASVILSLCNAGISCCLTRLPILSVSVSSSVVVVLVCALIGFVVDRP